MDRMKWHEALGERELVVGGGSSRERELSRTRPVSCSLSCVCGYVCSAFVCMSISVGGVG